MRHLSMIVVAVTFTFLSACGGNNKSTDVNKFTDAPGNIESEVSDIQVLTADKIENLDRMAAKTIAINYESDVNLEKEVTIMEYYDILRTTEIQTSDKEVFLELREVYRQLSERDPDKLIKIPQVITSYACGGCGCATPGKAGYALCTGSTCWCACCP